MEKWLSDDSCTACAACINICPVDAISFKENEYGFHVPTINNDFCINCNQCVNICPVHNKLDGSAINKLSEVKVFAGWSKSSSTRTRSTSGGVFSELARTILAENGAVVGAVYSPDFFTVHHEMVFDEAGLLRVRQSKYVQSEIRTTFREVKKTLATGKSVFFCGAPCQVAGLYSYLKNSDISNLYTADFICRGANSPRAYRAWLSSLQKTYGSRVTRVWFKNKEEGWNCFSTRVDFENGAIYRKTRYEDLYMRSYLERNLFIRPSCTQCKFKGMPRGADLTLADFWGIDKKFDEDRGTSMILINTSKGENLFMRTKASLEYHERTLGEAVKGNMCLNTSVRHGRFSPLFYDLLSQGNNFSDIFNIISQHIEYEFPLISNIIVIDDTAIDLVHCICAWKAQSYKNTEIIIIDVSQNDRYSKSLNILRERKIKFTYIKNDKSYRSKVINVALAQSKGHFIHIIDGLTYPPHKDVYRNIIKKMNEEKADIGCFGYYSTMKPTPYNMVMNGFCGTGNTYAFLKNTLIQCGENSKYTSYGSTLYNKVFRRQSIKGHPLWTTGLNSELYALAEYSLFTQAAAVCEKVLFSSEAIVFHPTISIPNDYENINFEYLFKSLAKFIRDMANIDDRLTSKTVEMVFQYEIGLYINARRHKDEDVSSKLYEHITSYFKHLIPAGILLEKFINAESKLSIATFDNHFLEVKLGEMNDELKIIKVKNKFYEQQIAEKTEENKKIVKEYNKAKDILASRIVKIAVQIHKKISRN